MKGLTKPDNFVTSSDKKIIYVAFFVAGACAFAIPSLASASPINRMLIDSIPLPVGIVMCVIPILMAFGIGLNQQHKFDDLLRERKARRAAAIVKKLLYRARFRGDEGGTQWEIINANNFDWTNAKLLIERTFDKETVTEKIALGHVPQGSAVTVDADLVDIAIAKWRVMVISREGQLIDFPDRWRDDTHAPQ